MAGTNSAAWPARRQSGITDPLIYQPLHSVLYRNTGKSTFEDISKQSGVGSFRGNGLGVAVADVDDDGWPDVFVANDAMPNFLFRNEGMAPSPTSAD